MERSQHVVVPKPAPKKTHVSRIFLSKPEEEALIDALKDLVTNGWRCNNAFRPGYVIQLEAAMAKKFPRANINGHKHINSKLTVWKKTYNQLSAIIDTRGFALEPDTHMIGLEDDVWEEYVKAHPEVEGMRNKHFPFYDDWSFIFGKDRANGNGACEFNDAILDLQHPHHEDDVVYSSHVLHGAKGKKPMDEVDGLNATNLDSDESDAGDYGSKSGTSMKGKSLVSESVKNSKKRKSLVTQTANPLVGVFGDFFKKNNAMLESLVTKYTSERQVIAEKTRQVQEIVGRMLCLSMVDRILATHKIVSVPYNIEIFLNMDDDSRATFVQMLLQNLMGVRGIVTLACHCGFVMQPRILYMLSKRFLLNIQ